MNLSNKTIEDWLLEQPDTAFPRDVDYKSFLKLTKRFLVNHVYPQMTPAALKNAIESGADAQMIYLNDHGEDHVNMVLERISDLLRQAATELSAYEAFVLIMATYIHDVGNFFGRTNHEKRAVEITKSLRQLQGVPGMGIDDIEWRVIHDTARAHGGRKDGIPKDTLEDLKDNLRIKDQDVRQQVLGAILRFADELADKRGREARILLANDSLQGSEVYHAYSFALHSIEVKANEVNLHFDLYPKDALTKKKKYKGNAVVEVFLFDEILNRVLKMYVEGIYCSRYMRSFYELRVVNADIRVTDYPTNSLARELVALAISFEERGYPAGWLKHPKSARKILGSGFGEVQTGQDVMEMVQNNMVEE